MGTVYRLFLVIWILTSPVDTILSFTLPSVLCDKVMFLYEARYRVQGFDAQSHDQ